MVFSDSICQDFPDTGRSKGSYIVFYQGVPIDNFTYFPGPVAQYISESGYNAACTARMDISHFRILNNSFLKKYPDMVLEKEPLVILD